MLSVGYLSMMVATGVVNASIGFASDTNRVNVIKTLHETVAQEDSVKAGSEQRRVDKIEHIAAEGVVYPYSRPAGGLRRVLYPSSGQGPLYE